MTRINLLPWREQERLEQQQEFLTILGVCAIVTVLLLVPVYLFIGSMITSQKSRNHFLEDKITELDDQIAEIKTLQTERNHLLARMNMIQQLQTDRVRVVLVYDELVRLMPQGMYLTEFDKVGNNFMISGIADSNSTISKFMHNIESSKALATPVLKEIKIFESDGVRRHDFRLEVSARLPSNAKTIEEEI